MFDDVLIESAGRDKKKGGWLTALISGVIHLGLVGALIAAGLYVKKNPEVIQKPIQAFVVAAAPPPPPPPPPPPAASHASLGAMPPAFLGRPDDRDSSFGRYLRECTAQDFIPGSAVPREFR